MWEKGGLLQRHESERSNRFIFESVATCGRNGAIARDTDQRVVIDDGLHVLAIKPPSTRIIEPVM